MFLVAVLIVAGLLWGLKFIFPAINDQLYRIAVVVGVVIIALYGLAMFGIMPFPLPQIY